MIDLTNHRIILASKSPRRQKLLRDMGVDFEVRLHDVDETFPEQLTNEEVAIYLCEKKASAFGSDELAPEEILITADTIVCLGNEILNKPADRQEAMEMLTKLSGRSHEVITGVCLKTRQRQHAFHVTTKVYFKKLDQKQMTYYVDQYRPFDKAGSYGIQEWIGVVGIEKIEGSYFNVVGLPTARLYSELEKFVAAPV